MGSCSRSRWQQLRCSSGARCAGAGRSPDAGDDGIIRPKIGGLIPLRAREDDRDRRRDAHDDCRAGQPLSKRIAGPASRLAGEIEKLHLEPRGEGERKRCNETAPATFEPARGFTDEEQAMKMVLSAIAMSAALLATDASAQGVNLTGPYRCVSGCVSGGPGLAFVTQNGWELNLVNEV